MTWTSGIPESARKDARIAELEASLRVALADLDSSQSLVTEWEHELADLRPRIAELEADLNDAIKMDRAWSNRVAELEGSAAQWASAVGECRRVYQSEVARLREALERIQAETLIVGDSSYSGDYIPIIDAVNRIAREALAGGGQHVQAVGERGERENSTWESATE